VTIKEFYKKHKKESRPIKDIIRHWVLEKEVDDFLGAHVLGGILISDLLIGDGMRDQIPERMREAFESLMGQKADSYSEVRALLIEKAEKGEASLNGLINKIQGELGEIQFMDALGSTVHQALKKNQEGWDVWIDRDGEKQFVQVKIHKDPGEVLDHIKSVNEKVEAGMITGEGEEIVQKIDFAVNDDIYDEVVARAKEAGLSNEILRVGASRDEIRGILEEGASAVQDGPIDGFFGELFSGAASGLVLHTAINGFLVWKGAKEKNRAIEDTVESTLITSGGVAGGLATEAATVALFAEAEGAAAILAGPIGGALVIGAGLGTRAILKRMASRKFLEESLVRHNEWLRERVT